MRRRLTRVVLGTASTAALFVAGAAFLAAIRLGQLAELHGD